MKLKMLAIGLLLPFTALASNTVTFFGEVSDSTCNVTINGVEGNVSVQLPTVQASALDAAAKYAGATPFKFTLSGCSAASGPEATTTVGMRLVSTSTISSGNLINIAADSPAKNVAIQILDDSASSKAIDFSLGEYSTALVAQPTTGNAEFPFTAQYYATDAATIGKVEAQLQYALTYK